MRRSEQRRMAVVALYQADVTGRPARDLLNPADRAFTFELVEGVAAEQERLDAQIERFSKGWTLARIAPLERNILRVALYEIDCRDDIPDEVAIDQAVEAAKELCGTDAPGFVNGILGAVRRESVGG